MRSNFQNFLLFLVLGAAAYGVFWAGEKWVWPPKPKPNVPKQVTAKKEEVGGLAGGMVLAAPPYDKLASLPAPKTEEPEKPKVVDKKEPRTLIALGNDDFYLKVLVTDKGGGVQQLLLTKFDDATRLGIETKVNGKPAPMQLIPGYKRPWDPQVEKEPPYVELKPTKYAGAVDKPVLDESELTKPSYVMLHYPAREDPDRPAATEELSENDIDRYPFSMLSEKPWKIVSVEQPNDPELPWKVVFEYEMGYPYHLVIRKTFSLARKDYDFKLSIEIKSTDKREAGLGKFRYQIVGPLGMPIEGEWYTSTYRTVYTGWTDVDGVARRAVDEPSNVHYKAGADRIGRQGVFNYAAVCTQYFGSALMVEGDYNQESQPWEYVRATRELNPIDAKINQQEYDPDKAFLYDITFRAVSTLLDPAKNKTITHNYAVYNGPVKVRLLKQMPEGKKVDTDLVNRYLDHHHLATLTDYHSNNWFGRRANSIYWSDLLIAATNLMHSVLGFLHGLVNHWGLSIVLLTVLVKLCMIIPSRRQQAINAYMQARIATIKPQLDELNAKYKDDFLLLSQEKAKLFRKAGIKSSAQFGGCLLLLVQMPILMGLYYCLQESVFFRLEPFLWMPNLAAPDMLINWGEGIPLLSSPGNRFSSFSFLYLGPFFNLLPIFAVILFWVQQKITMPPPTDDMQVQQQKMMKYMLIFSAFFFYKVAAGLCVYFIVSGIWSLLERKLIPKPQVDEAEMQRRVTQEQETKSAEPQGWLAKKMKAIKDKMEEVQKQAEQQRQIRNEPKDQQDLKHLSRNERRMAKKKKR